MMSRHWPAPAKLNLMLHITGQREDGYHTLQTALQFLEIGDVLHFNIRKDGVISRHSDRQVVTEQDDLIIRAAKAIKKISGCCLGADIHLEKRLPVGSGLGGGSSDAATTLTALNYLWETGLAVEQLATIGLQLGADIPVFVHGHAAWVEGIGERLTPIEPQERWYLIIQPNCFISTQQIFNAADLIRNTPAIKPSDFLRDGGRNDCEAVVKLLYHKVTEAMDWLNQFALAKMTGTGSCIFAGFDLQQQAKSTYQKLPPKWRGFVSKGINRSPLLAHLERINA